MSRGQYSISALYNENNYLNIKQQHHAQNLLLKLKIRLPNFGYLSWNLAKIARLI